MTLPYPQPTPGHGILSDFAINIPSSPTLTIAGLPQPPHESNNGERGKKESFRSEAWEMLSDSGASFISPSRAKEATETGSINLWKSAGNGEVLSEFGGQLAVPPYRQSSCQVVDGANTGSMRSKSSSVRSLAVSLSRRASRHLLSRSTSANSQLDAQVEPTERTETHQIEEIQEHLPPSPASTVGIARRHSTLSLLERPSTIRLVSPPPIDFSEPRPVSDPQRDGYGTYPIVHIRPLYWLIKEVHARTTTYHLGESPIYLPITPCIPSSSRSYYTRSVHPRASGVAKVRLWFQ
jgi:hypothetical protein